MTGIDVHSHDGKMALYWYTFNAEGNCFSLPTNLLEVGTASFSVVLIAVGKTTDGCPAFSPEIADYQVS